MASLSQEGELEWAWGALPSHRGLEASTLLWWPVAFLAYTVALNVLFLSFSLIMAESPLVGTTADSTKTPLKRALSEHKVLGIGGPQGLPSITHLSSLFFLSPLSFLPPLASLFAAPSLSSFSFLHSNLLWNWSELHIALFSTDLHVRGSRVIGV